MKLEPPPRRIEPEIARAIKKDRRLLAIIGWIVLLSGAGMGVLFWMLSAPAWSMKIDATGEKAEGSIVEMVEYTNVRYGSVHPWGIRYRFETRSGELLRGETETTNLEFVRAHRVGDKVTISYDPDRPERNKILGVEVAGLQTWVFYFPGVQLLIGLILLVLGHIIISNALAVYEQGTETPGRILRAKLLRSVNMGWKHPMSIKYGFEDEMGQERTGKVWSLHEVAREFKEGRECTVLYNRVNPSRSILYDTQALYLE